MQPANSSIYSFILSPFMSPFVSYRHVLLTIFLEPTKRLNLVNSGETLLSLYLKLLTVNHNPHHLPQLFAAVRRRVSIWIASAKEVLLQRVTRATLVEARVVHLSAIYPEYLAVDCLMLCAWEESFVLTG